MKKFELPRTPAQWLEAVMNAIFFLCGILAVGCVAVITIYMFLSGLPAIGKIGPLKFLFGTEWASTASEPKYGILPFLLSSIYVLSSAKEIRATVSVDGISHDVTATDKPVLYEEEGKKIISNQIEFDTASVGIYIELWKTKTVDVKLSYTGEPAKNYHLVSFDYEPKQITPVPRPPSVTWQLCPKRAPRISSVRLPVFASLTVCLPALSRR